MTEGEFYTGEELYQKIGILEGERAVLQGYIKLLEKTLDSYRCKKRNKVVNRLIEENLQYKVQLQEKDKEICELMDELNESQRDISDLEKRLDNALSTIDWITEHFKLPSSSEEH